MNVGVKKSLILSLIASFAAACHGQVYISEIVSDNGEGLRSETGDTPDWVELYNSSFAPINLEGWFLTDDVNDLTKWQLPATNIAGKGFLIVFASGENLADSGYELHTNFRLSAAGEFLAIVQPDGETAEHHFKFPALPRNKAFGFPFDEPSSAILLGAGTPCTAHIPVSADDADGWKMPDFDDSGWLQGTTGVGYETKEGFENLIGLDVLAMKGTNCSVYIRVPFELDDAEKITDLLLKMKYDDAFVAYLNGEEVATSDFIPQPLAWNTEATGGNSDPRAVIFEEFSLKMSLSALKSGKNVLAIQALNHKINSTDLLIIPQLEAHGTEDINPSVHGVLESPTPGKRNNKITRRIH